MLGVISICLVLFYSNNIYSVTSLPAKLHYDLIVVDWFALNCPATAVCATE